jgi:hypothetical protein
VWVVEDRVLGIVVGLFILVRKTSASYSVREVELLLLFVVMYKNHQFQSKI